MANMAITMNNNNSCYINLIPGRPGWASTRYIE